MTCHLKDLLSKYPQLLSRYKAHINIVSKLIICKLKPSDTNIFICMHIALINKESYIL